MTRSIIDEDFKNKKPSFSYFGFGLRILFLKIFAKLTLSQLTNMLQMSYK